MDAVALLLGVLPVLLFLAALRLLDSFKLVSRAATVRSLSFGAVSAFLALAVSGLAMNWLGVDPPVLRKYLAPAFEECLKASYLLLLISRAKVGFMVDAAIHGFAIGTGFAVVENVYYVKTVPDGSIGLWLVRGLGTAVMHGSATAIVGLLAKTFSDFDGPPARALTLAGLAIAIGVHSLYNHFVLNPFLTVALLFAAMPLLVLVVFERSEAATRKWLGTGLARDVELLESILSGSIVQSRVGAYLDSIRTRFAGPVVADMLCYLRVHLELAARAKGILLARSAGVDIPIDPGVLANLRELRYLERAIGPTGKAAILPLLGSSKQDLWQIYMLGSGSR